MSLDVSSFCEGKGTTRYLLVNLKTYPSHVYCRRQLAVFYDELAYSSWMLLDNDSIDNLGTWLVPLFVLVMIRVLLIPCLIFAWKKNAMCVQITLIQRIIYNGYITVYGNN